MFAFFVVYLISAPPRRRAPAAAGAMYPYTLAAGVRKRGCEMYKTKTMLDKYTRTSQKNSEIKLDPVSGAIAQGVRGPFPRK